MGRGRPGIGVEVRENTIRLRFTWQQRRYTPNLHLKPTPPNIKAAERLAARIKQEIDRGVFDYAAHFPDGPGAKVASPNMTFGVLADLWLETVVAEESTRQLYGKQLKATWKPALGDKPIAAIRYSDIAKVISARAKVVSAKTINNDMTPLRHVFAMARKDRLITEDVTLEFTSLGHQTQPPDPFKVDEVEKILGHLRAKSHEAVWAYYEFAFQTGLRPSEQIALRWGKIDWDAMTARIDAARTVNTEKGTKTNKVRYVDLTPRAIAALKAMKPHTFMKGADAPIFFNPNTGRPWTSDRSQREHFFHPALKALGLRSRDAYQTRHTYATTALMAGVNPAYISRQLGHANTGMLFKVYGRWIDGADGRREANKLAGAWGEFGPDLAQKPGKAL